MFAVGVMGGFKSLVWDWMIAPFWRRAKIVGEIEKAFIHPLGITQDGPETDSIFSADVAIRVWITNRRSHPTLPKTWILGIDLDGQHWEETIPYPPDDDEPRDRRAMPFELLIEACSVAGWLHFMVRGKQSETLQPARFSLSLIDSRGTRHRIAKNFGARCDTLPVKRRNTNSGAWAGVCW